MSFIEGGCVMATELTGARVLAPMYGTSLYVWSAVLAVTLSGLAFGYFYGGRLSSSTNRARITLFTVIAASLFMMCMPLTSRFVIWLAWQLPLLLAVTISSLLVLFPPLFFMGMVSPLIIAQLNDDAKNSGRRAGEVYAVSTLGGILFTFLTGFWLLPALGNSKLMLLLGALQALLPLFLLFRFKMFFPFLVIAGCCTFAAITAFSNDYRDPRVIYSSSGIHGKVEVIDYPDANGNKATRYLLVNNIIQTAIDLTTRESELEYLKLVKANLPGIVGDRKALVLGLGGGSAANMFADNAYDVTAVELDERNVDMAKKYFFLNENVQMEIDDARNYLNHDEQIYDVILVDLFRAEDPPYHVLTMESLSKIKSMLSTNGKLIINTYGFLSAELGKGNHAMITTLRETGFHVRGVAKDEAEESRNLILIASRHPQPVKLNSEIDLPVHAFRGRVLRDDDCPLDYLNAEAALKWRQLYLKNFILHKPN